MTYNDEYQRENIKRIVLKLNRRTDDKDLIEWVEKHENVQGYLKELIRKDMTAQE